MRLEEGTYLKVSETRFDKIIGFNSSYEEEAGGGSPHSEYIVEVVDENGNTLAENEMESSRYHEWIDDEQIIILDEEELPF